MRGPMTNPQHRPSVLGVGLLAFALLALGCSNNGTPGRDGGANGDLGPNGPDVGGGGGDGGPPRDFATATVSSVRVEPANATLVSVDGSQPEQTFRFVATYSDGTARDLTAGWTIDTLGLGELGVDTGTFVASGVRGGTATIEGSALNPSGGPTLTASITITINVELTLVAPDVTPQDVLLFDGGATSDPPNAAGLVYPLDEVVFPQNVYPADVQWTNGDVGDLMHVEASTDYVTFNAYLRDDGDHHWLFDQSAWSIIAQTSSVDEHVNLSVTRRVASSGAIVSEPPVRMRFAPASLNGTVYYWDVGATRIVRVNDGEGVAESFMPTPPFGAGGQNCVGCHAVSNSGRYMVGRLGPGLNIAGIFDLTEDLTVASPPTTYPIDAANRLPSQWFYSSWNPDDTRLVASSNQTDALSFIDVTNGSVVAQTGMAAPSGIQPAWSPDGTQIAFVTNANNWGANNTTGDVAMLDVAGSDALGANRVLHDASAMSSATPTSLADSYPTWTPDSTQIAFANGTGSRSGPEFGEESTLYIMNRDGSDVRRLSTACGGDTSVDDFQPNFSPFQQGGFYWLSFLSRRSYGNAQVGTGNSEELQIWVAAIRDDAPPGEDPSSVAYWLPGQNPQSATISAEWAPRACRADGESCSVGSQCCGGDCRPNDQGVNVCSPPPPERCRQSGETCSSTADCCVDALDLSCEQNVCIPGLG